MRNCPEFFARRRSPGLQLDDAKVDSRKQCIMNGTSLSSLCVFAPDSVALIQYLAQRCGQGRIAELLLNGGECSPTCAENQSILLTSPMTKFPQIDFDATESLLSHAGQATHLDESGIVHAVLVGSHATSQRFYGSWSSSLAELIAIGMHHEDRYINLLGKYIGWLSSIKTEEYEDVHYAMCQAMYCGLLCSRIAGDVSAMINDTLWQSADSAFSDLCDGDEGDVVAWSNIISRLHGKNSNIAALESSMR